MRATIAGLAAVALALTACGGGQPAPAGEARPLTVLLGATALDLDPHTSFDDVSSVVLVNVYEPLVRFDADMRLAPGLALRWINPDDRTWRFFLDPDARFSDGSPLVASDVKFSFERLRSVAGSQLTGFVRHVSGVHVVDEHTIDLRTEKPVAILNGLALIPIVSESHTRRVGDRLRSEPLGTGPYRVATWEPGRRVVLDANPHFRPLPALARVEILLRSDDVDPATLADGRTDMVLYPGRKLLEALEARGGAHEVLAADSLSVLYVTLNLRPTLPGLSGPNPLRDRRVREALALSLDRAELGRPPLRGYDPATQLTVPQVFGYDPALEPPARDPDRARALLAEAGHPALKVALDVVGGGTATIHQRILDQWARAGVQGHLRERTEEQLADDIERGNFTATIEGYVCTSADAGEILTYLLHTPSPGHGYGAGNHAAWSSAEVDRLAEQNLSVFDPRQRLRMLQQALRIATSDLPYIPLFRIRDYYVVRKGIRWRPPINGEIRFDDVHVADGPR